MNTTGNLTVDSESIDATTVNTYFDLLLVAAHYAVALLIVFCVLCARIRRRRGNQDSSMGDDGLSLCSSQGRIDFFAPSFPHTI